MFINLDIIVILIIVILVVLVLNGYVSLCESRVLAIVQIRIGPALFLFGILTPLTDGINLFVNFVVFVVSFDIFYFIMFMIGTGCVIFVGWFFFPIGFIIMLDSGFTLFLMLILHVCSSILSTVCVGCFLFSSCFVYLSAVSTLFFSIISEGVIFLLYITIYLLDGFSMYGINDICVGQLYISNFYTAGIIFVGIFWVSMLLDGLKLPFDYTECESELVSGVITELSGIFFCLYSVMEISHLLLTTVLIASLCFGGLFICFNAILILVFGFFYPSVIGFSLNITTAQSFVVMFLFIITFLIFQWLAITNFIAFLF